MVDVADLIKIIKDAKSISEKFTSLNRIMNKNNLESINLEGLFNKEQRENLIKEIKSIDSRRRGAICKADKNSATKSMSDIGKIADSYDSKDVLIDIVNQIEADNYIPKLKAIIVTNNFYEDYKLMTPYLLEEIEADRVQRSFNIESYINIDRIERQRLYDSLVETYENAVEASKNLDYDELELIGIRFSCFKRFLGGFKTILENEYEPNLDIYYDIQRYNEEESRIYRI